MGSRRGSEEYDDLSLDGANDIGELIVDDGDPYDDDLLDPNPQQTKIEQIIQDMSIPDEEISGAGEEEELPHAERRDDDHDDMDGIVDRLNSGLNRAHFPVVSLPSLDQSANNTPRVSYGFGLSQYLPSGHATNNHRVKTHHSRSSGLIKDMVKEDSREENHRGSSGPRDEVSREDFRIAHANLKRPAINSPAIGQRLREKEQQVRLQMYERDIQLLQERIRSLQNELESAETARQDALDWRDMRDAPTDSSLEALRGRILTKAIEERDRANQAKQQSEVAVHELERELIKFQTENEAIRSAAESELQEVEDAYNRAQAAADGYRLSESEARKELELSRKENLKLQRQLEGILQEMHNQEDQMRMAQSMINEHSAREEEFRHKLAEKDQQIHKLARSLENLQLTTEGMNPNRAQLQGHMARSKPDQNQGEDNSEQIDALNWQIYDLKRQLAAKLPQKQSHSNETETKDIGTSCSLLEDFYIQFTQKILEVHGLAEPGTEPSLKEVHTKLSQSLHDLKARCQALTEENIRMRRSLDSQAKTQMVVADADHGVGSTPTGKGQSVSDHHSSTSALLAQQLAQQSMEFENKLAQQQNTVLELQQKLSHYETVVKQCRVELSSQLQDNEALKDRLAIANAKAAEHARLCRLQEERQNSINREQQTSARGSLMTPKQSGMVDRDVEVHISDPETDLKVKQLEKQARDLKSDLSLKVRLITELQTTKYNLEQELEELRAARDEVGELRKKAEAAEKKLATVSQDVTARDKKNIELFENTKKLKSENQELLAMVQALQEKMAASKSTNKSATRLATAPSKKSQMVAMAGLSEAGSSTGLSGVTSLLATPMGEEETARSKWLMDNIESARKEMKELYRMVDRFYLEKNTILQNLEQQSKKNMTLSKEVQFLRGCLEALKDTEDKKIELEMLSSEETELLLDEILKRALKSSSMQRRLRESMEFFQLCSKLTQVGPKG